MPSRFPYRGIVDEPRASILEGRLAGGERLPSQNELAERYRTSRTTMRRAIALLKAEGLVDTEQGRGAFVRPKPHVRLLRSGENFRRQRRAGRLGFNAQVEDQGQTLEQRLLDVGWVKAPREVALRLDVDDEARAAVRRRLSVVNASTTSSADADAGGGRGAESKLSRGDPVVRTPRTVYDARDRAVAVQYTVAAADTHRFRYEVRMR